MFKSLALALCVFAFSSGAFAEEDPPSGPHRKFEGSGNNQYLVARSQNTYVFVDKDLVFSNPPSTEDPIPAVGGPVYILAQTRDGLIPNRIIAIAQCSIPYALGVSAQDVLDKNGKLLRMEQASNKYDATPSFVVAPSSRLGRVWDVLCNDTWDKSQHWGVLTAGQLIERVSRRNGNSKVLEVYNENLSQGLTPQKTKNFPQILSEK